MGMVTGFLTILPPSANPIPISKGALLALSLRQPGGPPCGAARGVHLHSGRAFGARTAGRVLFPSPKLGVWDPHSVLVGVGACATVTQQQQQRRQRQQSPQKGRSSRQGLPASGSSEQQQGGGSGEAGVASSQPAAVSTSGTSRTSYQLDATSHKVEAAEGCRAGNQQPGMSPRPSSASR